MNYAEVRYSFLEADQSDSDLPPNRKSACGPALLGHMKIESAVRYLGIEIDDTIEIADKIDV